MPVAEKQQVIDAINKLGRKVTVADVAAKTGLPVLVAGRELNKVAAETNGHLQVAATGDIAYAFDMGFQNAYLAKGIQRTLQLIWEKSFAVGFYLLRISFGIMLVLSLLIVVALIFVAIMAMNSRNSDNDRDDGGFNFSFFDFMILRDLFYWGAYSTYNHPTPIGYQEPKKVQRRKGNFLTDCFSFLFGDGDPNRDKEERRWQLIAEVIREHKGVVTAEQLAPYTGADPKKEDGALPVLVRFNGNPEVTETGNIVYTFPELQVSTGMRFDRSVPAFFREWTWQFSQVPGESLIPVYIVAGLNFFGAWWLFVNMSHLLVLREFAPLITLLVVYGSLFVGIPVARLVAINVLNGKIQVGNKKRQQSAELLEQPEPELQKKLLEAKKYEVKEKLLTSEKVVYTTEKDLLDNEFDASP